MFHNEKIIMTSFEVIATEILQKYEARLNKDQLEELTQRISRALENAHRQGKQELYRDASLRQIIADEMILVND